jgi:aryl-alcohol dehydrogenase-like predicted oxidoreductase
VVVATKFMAFPSRLTGAALPKALARSLKRLGLPAVDLYQMHWPFPPVSIETWMEAMAEVHHQGLVRAVGVSNYSLEQMRRAHAALARHGVTLVSNQVKFSLLDREPLHQRAARCLPRAQRDAHRLRAARQRGALRQVQRRPSAAGMARPPLQPRGLCEDRPLLRLLRGIGEANGKTPAQVAINWCIAKGTLPIPGTKTGAQARGNAGALGWSLTPEEVARLEEAAG